MAVRAVLAASAAIFLIFALGDLHVAIWAHFAPRWGPARAALGVLVLDIVIAAILGAFAVWSRPGRIETEARQVRDNAWAQFRGGFGLRMLAVGLGQFARRRTRV